jgi:hypothetical protein
MTTNATRRGRWSDLLAVLLVAAGLGVLAASFWPREEAGATPGREPAPLPIWVADPRPLDLAQLAAAPGLVLPREVALGGDHGPPFLALFVLDASACSSVAGELADFAAQLAALDPEGHRVARLAVVLDPTPGRARRFAAAARLPVPTGYGWDARAAEALGRFADHGPLLQQLVLVDRRSGLVAGRLLLSTAITPAAGKRRLLARILDLRPPHGAAADHARRSER